MKRALQFLALLLILTSCGRKVYVQDAFEVTNNRVKNDTPIRVNTYYGGDAFSYISFQVDIENNSDDTLHITQRDIELQMAMQGQRRLVSKPIRKDELINDLLNEQEQLQSAKRRETTAGVILGGAGILTSVLAGGGAGQNILIGSDAAVDILDRRDRYGLAQGSVEDLIIYHEEYTLDDAKIAPGGKGSFDVHFDRELLDTRAELVVYAGGRDYVTEYALEVNQLRVR